MIAGIDEAGKGPVLGPMCIAGVAANKKNLALLAHIGVKDSKKLSAKRREVLAEEIRDLASKYFILEVSPLEIDELRKIMTMNEIMVISFARVLEELKPDRVFVDAADVNAARFGENIKMKYRGKLNLTSEHYADEKYPIVSAASILAKVERDMLIRKLEEKVGVEIGSGYPHDPKTIKFLEQWIQEHKALPDFARSSWETSKHLLEKFNVNQRTMSDFL